VKLEAMRTWITLALLAIPALGEWGPRYQRGVELLRHRQLKEARGELRLALQEAELGQEQGDRLGAILDRLGHVEFAAGRYYDAKRYFEKSLRLPSRSPVEMAASISNAGQACMALGELNRAEEYFQRAIAVAPDHPGLWHRLGQASLLRGKYPEAESALRNALRNSSEDTNIWNDLASVLEIQGRRQEAILLLRDAVARTSDGQNRARMRRNLAVLEWKVGSRHTAVALLRKAVAEMESTVGTEHPDTAGVLSDYADALAKLGEKAESRTAARRASAIRSAFSGQDGASTKAWRELRK
jgi:tetratricopeptide (TPR) repeat protein